MLVTIETLRVRIGLDAADTSKDTELEMYYAIALSILEVYCNRKFEYAADVEQFTHEAGYNISLRRYPLDSIAGISDENSINVTRYHAHNATGIIEFDGYLVAHDLTIAYSGGYQDGQVPAAIQWVVLQVFDMVYTNETATTGETGAAIKSVASDGARVEYDLSTSVSANAAIDLISGLPSNVVAIIDGYRRLIC